MSRSRRNTFWARALRSRTFIPGLVLTALIVLVAVFAPTLAPFSPSAQNLTGGLLPPSATHWFGTDQLGRDVLSRMLFAARTDLRIAVAAALTPFVFGVLVGLVAGYLGGATDWVASRATDIVIAFPFYVMVIALVFAVGAGENGIIVAFALVGWVGYARVLKATTGALRDSGWVRAARGGGLSHARVMFRHILPNVLPQAIVLFMTEVVLIMVAIVTLGYLGLGVQPPTPDWGTMIADGQQFVTSHWWLSTLPGLAVVVVGISLSLLGDGIGDALRVGEEPRRRRRRERRERAAGGTASSLTSSRAEPLAAGEIRVRDLTVRSTTTGRALVDGVGLDVAPGEAVGLVGESGSGKSLTLRSILGIMPDGTRVTEGEATSGGRVGMVFQDPLTALDPLTRVGHQLVEVLEIGGGLRRARAVERARELMRLVQLDDSRRIFRSYPHQLSGGQRQRIVIALALARDPAILLADEPTTALDVTVQRQVLALLDTLRRTRGLTLLLVSHDLAVVSTICSRMAVMSEGRIIEQGSTDDIVLRPTHEVTRALVEAVPKLPELERGAA